jgi:hypothetical protein
MPRAGQTKPAVAPRLPDRIAIGVLTQTFPPELVDRVLVRIGRGEQRQRLLPARVVLYYTLAMCLFTQVGYEEVMRLLVEGLAWARRWQGSWQIPDKSSIARARARLGPAPLRALFVEVARPLATRKRRGRGIAGGGCWRWMAPPWTWRTPPPTWRRSAGPVAARGQGRSRRCAWWGWWSAAPTRSWTRPWAGRTWARGRWHPRSGARWGRGCCCWSTRACAAWSCGAPSKPRGRSWCGAGRQDVKLKVLAVFADGSWASELGARHPKHKRVAVRVVDYRLDDPGRPGEREGYRLITTILDPEQAPAAELSALYLQRWETETALDELKTHQRGPGGCSAAAIPTGSARRSGAPVGPLRHPHAHAPGRPGGRGRP